MNKPRTLPIPGLSCFKIYMSTKKTVHTMFFVQVYKHGGCWESSYEHQRVNPFGLFRKVGEHVGRSEKNIAYQNGPSDTVASESSPEPARGQLKPLLPFALRGEARMVLPPKFNGWNLKSWWVSFKGISHSRDFGLQVPCFQISGIVCLDDSSEWSRADPM